MNKSRHITITVLVALTLIFSASLCMADSAQQGVCFGQIGYKCMSDGKAMLSASFEGYGIADSGVVVCMLYNAGEELVGVSFDKISDFSLGYTKTPDTEFEKCRLMLWESLDNLKPLCPDEQISVRDITNRILTVSFDISEVDSINETLPQGDMLYAARFNLPSQNSLTKNGYVLAGFTVNGEAKTFGEEITVGEEAITIVPVFSKLISYTIEYYQQTKALDGYALYETDSSNSVFEGTQISLDTQSLPKYYGFVFSEDNEENVLSATQTSSGVTLKVYYDRLIVTLECYRHNPYVTDYYLYETKVLPVGYVNTTVSLNDFTLPEYPNYSYNSSAQGSIHSGIVTQSGLTLRVYYDLIIEEQAQEQVIHRLNGILTDLDKIAFTRNERIALSTVKSTINQTLTDAKSGAYIYMEGYVREYYGGQVDKARKDVEGLKETGEFDAFKSKLAQLRAKDIEYLAKTMFGIDDISKWI